MMSLRKIAVVAENLEPVRVVVFFQPAIYLPRRQIGFATVNSPVIGNVVDTEKRKVVQSTTRTLSSVGRQHSHSQFLPTSPLDDPNFLRVLFSPSVIVRPHPFSHGVIMFQIIRFVSRLLTAGLLVWWKFCTHRNIIP